MASILKPIAKMHLQDSIRNELFAAHTYQHIASQMQSQGFFGAQAFFEKEAASELEHYKELRNFVNDMGDVFPTPAIDMADTVIVDIQQALMLSYDTEKYLLDQYNERAVTCLNDNDIPTASLFFKFVDKQVHSVGEYNDLISRLYKNPKDVFEFDEYLKEL